MPAKKKDARGGPARVHPSPECFTHSRERPGQASVTRFYQDEGPRG